MRGWNRELAYPGAVGSVAAGIVLFGEPAAALRLLSAALIVVGIVGLKLTAN